jgi:transcription antitermination factor NusG
MKIGFKTTCDKAIKGGRRRDASNNFVLFEMVAHAKAQNIIETFNGIVRIVDSKGSF